jgi:hypothetical protein
MAKSIYNIINKINFNFNTVNTFLIPHGELLESAELLLGGGLNEYLRYKIDI